MPLNQTPGGENSETVPQDGQTEGSDFELQLQLFQLQRADRQLQRRQAENRREEAALTEAQRESAAELTKHAEFNKATHMTESDLLELRLLMGDTEGKETVRNMMEKEINVFVDPLKEKALSDPFAAELLDIYSSLSVSYNKATDKEPWPPKDPAKRRAVVVSIIGMRETMKVAKAYLANPGNNSGNDSMWMKVQRVTYLGSSEKSLKTVVSSGEQFNKKAAEISARVSTLFGTADKPGVYQKMADAPRYVSSNKRAMAATGLFMQQFDRFITLTRDKTKPEESVSLSIGADPKTLMEVEDSVAWMELAADALRSIGSNDSQVASYLAGTLQPTEAETVSTETPEPAKQVEEKKSTEAKEPIRTVSAPDNAYPERLKTTEQSIPTGEVEFQKWEGAWIDAGTDSVFARLQVRHKAFREIRKSNKENSLVVSSHAAMLPLIKQYAQLETSIPNEIRKKANVEDLQKIEDVLMQFDKALLSFETAWSESQKKPAATDEITSTDEPVAKRPQATLDGIVNGLMEETEPQKLTPTPAKEVAGIKTTMGAVPDVQPPVVTTPVTPVGQPKTQVEVVTPGKIRVPNGGTVQFVDAGGNVSDLYTLNIARGYNQLTLHQYGIATFNNSTNEWTMPKPPNVREVRGAIAAPVMTPEQKVQYEKFGGALSQYFQQPGGLNRLEEKLSKAMKIYEVVKKDQERFGGRLEWQTYMQEARQLYVRYRLALPSGGWPTDQNNQIELLSATAEFEQVLQDYVSESAQWKENPPPEELPVWNNTEAAKLPWRSRVENATKTYRKMKEEYGPLDAEPVKELMEKFSKTMTQYSSVYYAQTEPGQRWDEQAVAANVSQMERLIHYYGLELTKAASEPAVQPASLSVQGLLGSLQKVVQQGSDNLEVQKKMRDGMFQPGQPRFEMRKNLIYGSTLMPSPKLDDQEVKSLLWMKAHLREFAGKDGKLNAGDMDAIAGSIEQNIMSDPVGLYNTILKERGINPNSQDAKGLRMALNLEGLSESEISQLNRGRRAIRSPLMRLFMSSAQKGQLAAAEQGLMRVQSLRSEIPAQVHQRVTTELTGFMNRAHIPAYSPKGDTGHASISQASMKEFEYHVGVLKAVSQRALKDVVDRTGASIETYLPDGLSVEFIDWILDSHARPEGRKGSAPGSSFWIEGAPVSTAAERAKRNGSKVDNRTTAQTETPDELPEARLGEPEATLGTPTSLE